MIPFHGMKVGWNHSRLGKSSCKREPAKQTPVSLIWAFGCFVEFSYEVRSAACLTWMSSSLEANSDTKTFFPSESWVRDTQSLPVARRWASSGSISSRKRCTTLSRLKVGWKTPRVCFLASLAVTKIIKQSFSEGETTHQCMIISPNRVITKPWHLVIFPLVVLWRHSVDRCFALICVFCLWVWCELWSLLSLLHEHGVSVNL